MTLDITLIRDRMSRSLCFRGVYYRASVDSTNIWAADLVRAGQVEACVVIADFQEAGRGRQGRTWLAPPGSSLLVTVAVPLKPEVPSMDAMFAAAVCMCRSVSRCTGLVLNLKWPNDILLQGRKVGGLLGETVHHVGRRWAIVGAGVNANFWPPDVPELPESATSLQVELGRPTNREEVLVEYLTQFEGIWDNLESDPDAAFQPWVALLSTIGSQVTVHDSAGAWAAEAIGVRRDGSLTVRDEVGTVRQIYAADVSLRVS